MRLFIAISLNNDTKSRLLALRDELHAHSSRGNFSLPDNLHLTLAFLGECGVAQTAAAKAAMDAVVFQPFDLIVERIGRFRRDGGDIWWAGVRENNALLDLHRSLNGKLTAAGFSLDNRKFSPHITLGRGVVTGAAPRQIEPFRETVSSIELMKSERVHGKLTYTVVYARGKR